MCHLPYAFLLWWNNSTGMWGLPGMELDFNFAFLFVISYNTRTSSNEVLPTSIGSINLGVTCFSVACLTLHTNSNMMITISPTSIVAEVLRNDNYDDWRACMKSYMLAQDLWDLIEPADHQEGDREGDSESIDHREGDSKAWRKKNAAALHAIQISCSPHMLSRIRSINIAKVAWDTLASSKQRHSKGSGAVSNEMIGQRIKTFAGAVSNRMKDPLLDLYTYVHKGDWDATENYLSRYPDAIKAKIKPYGGTALHVAASAGNLKVVEELVKLMSEKELEIQDDDGNTALSCAATVGITKMAECLLSKNKNLVTFVNKEKMIPLVEACIRNQRDMALYLYSVTPVDFLCNGNQGSPFLQYAIGAQMLDIALDFLHRFPHMTTAMDDDMGLNALVTLSLTPGIFRSGNRLALWQQWIYSCISIEPIATASDNFRICISDQSPSGSKSITLQVLSKFRGFAINLLKFLGIKKIYDMKKIHIYSDKILQCMCEHISKLDYERLCEANIHKALQGAVQTGMVEFVSEVIKYCPYVMNSGDNRSRTLFMSSIENRHEKVLSLLYGREASRVAFVSLIDSNGNTMLHMAAKLSPPSQLARIFGAALQMQRELQWYKEVESMIMNPTLKDVPNKNRQKARELFTHDHKDLLEKGEQWMKGSATSCTVVGALIITMMFTVAFTVPGGNVQETGYPVFKHEKSFIVFIVADAISLFSSSTSVLMFLGILTSRYAEEDFLKSLPTKLILGLSTLFLSIATMMVTFSASLIIMLNGRLEIIIPVVLLASIPVTFFMLLQFPLLVEIFVSTYGPGIFNKKMKYSNMTTYTLQQQQRFPGHKEQFVEAESSQGSGAVSNEMNGPLLTLYKYAHNGDWDAIKNCLSRYPNAKKATIKPSGGTVLHVAAFSGNLKVVEELVKLMSVEELEMQDNRGNTGVSSAAFAGMRKMAECLVSKNRNLVTFVNAQKKIPLVQACISNCTDMALDLFSVTPFEFLCQDNGHHGSYFLQCAIGAQMLGIVFDFLHRFPCMATKTDDVLKSNALIRLPTSPQIFPSATRLASWQQFICSC
ncbi:hypothetical protein SADUNF_Sadunf17G0052600 [Salix dunnii]|uniref:PGG domain-containing protein n=1 Tax=Salix dunnii TaxID=1413687 RepID=A0A835J5I8_9ROSI|nr:hypothetical protein SADUNF_Sadunf17G0052600 [Salix dunnii]